MHALSIAAVVIALLAALDPASARPPRSTAAKQSFQRSTPCPSTGKPRGACPGYVIDHIEPLCAGGADRAHNMQWQTAADARAKDREEARLCRSIRRTRK